MSDGPQGISRQQYARRCAALGREPGELLSPLAREAALPAWLSDALIATDAAVSKLQDWARLAPPARDRLDLFTHLVWIGDEAMALQAAEILVAHAPPPVVAYVERAVVFVGVSHNGGVLGGCSPRPHWARPWLITLSKPERFDELLLHEVAHCWLLDEAPPGAELETAFQTATVQYAPLEGVPDHLLGRVLQRRQRHQVDEDQARQLVKSWGFSGEL